jgi:hypothetical protein
MNITAVWQSRGTLMGKAVASEEIDRLAWQFLCSPFTRRDYWDWPLDRRIDAYLRHLQRLDVLNNGAAYDTLIERVMANIPRARRDGLLDAPHR